MPAAEPLPLPPLDEPVFGAAMEYLLDCCEGIAEQDAQRVVMAVRQFNPEVYAASRGASSMSGLAPDFRFVLASQAAGILGEDVAAVLRPAGRGGGAGHAEGEEEEGLLDSEAESLDSEEGPQDSEVGTAPGRAVAACLPASVLTVLGSDGEEDVGVDAMEDGGTGAGGLSVVGDGEPALVPTPPITSQRSAARGRGKGPPGQGPPWDLPPRHSPYPQRTGRSQGPPRYWEQGTSAPRQRAGANRLVQDAAGPSHNSKPMAARSPADRGSGCQRQ